MAEKLAIKRMPHTDITWFKTYFDKHPQSRQKGITLNADVFLDRFYPDLKRISGERFNIDVQFFGPGVAGKYPVQRIILKQDKNWRLNGSIIDNPPEERARFDTVTPGDLALIEFAGNSYPESVKLYIISASNPDDANLHSLLSEYVGTGRDSMVAIEYQWLETMIQSIGLPLEHPVYYDLILGEVLEDVAQDGIEGTRSLETRTASLRRVSSETLQRARENAGRVGRTGEEFINAYLSELKHRGEIRTFEWNSIDNAISPYDFTVHTLQETVLVEVKSTEGNFENTIHISFNELLKMREVIQYDLYRVYNIFGNTAQVGIAHNMGNFARSVIDGLGHLPPGVHADSISVAPDILPFGPVISISL